MPLLIALIATLGVFAQAPQHSAPDFEKRRVLSESLLGKRPATAAEVQQLLTDALHDPHPSMRREAVGSIATILTFAHQSDLPEPLGWTVRLRPVAEALRPELLKAMRDSDSSVRHEAVRGVVAAEAYAKPGASLSLPTLRMLAAHFDEYRATTDREFIVAAIRSGFRSEEPEARAISLAVLKKALQGNDPYVVQAAGHSATKADAPELLPLLVAQLKNPAYVARMGVAQGIASYGAAARPFLPQLEAALAAETHDITKKTIAGTISVITK